MLQAAPERQATACRAVAVSPQLPRALLGLASALAIGPIAQFGVRGGPAALPAEFEEEYAAVPDPRLQATGREAFEAVRMLKAVRVQPYEPAPGADYPRSPFGRALAALAADLDDRLGDVVILTMSEFGRMVRQNGNGGTDHGHGNAMLVIGGDVRGGRVVGRWPGLGPDQLYEGRDLAVTTDFRDVFGEVVARHLGIADTSRIFPGYPIEASRFPGVLG